MNATEIWNRFLHQDRTEMAAAAIEKQEELLFHADPEKIKEGITLLTSQGVDQWGRYLSLKDGVLELAAPKGKVLSHCQIPPDG